MIFYVDGQVKLFFEKMQGIRDELKASCAERQEPPCIVSFSPLVSGNPKRVFRNFQGLHAHCLGGAASFQEENTEGWKRDIE